MTAKEYQKRQNEIFRKHIDRVWIPKEQMQDFEVTLLMVTRLEKYIRDNRYMLDMSVVDHDNQLHCATYAKEVNPRFWCYGCPMHEEGNGCFQVASTYNRCKEKVQAPNFDDTEIKKELLELAQEFVDANQHLKPPKKEKKCKMQS